MMLNDFYNITACKSEEDTLQAQFTINPDHDIFRGHFPGQPVVPGVCMIQIAKELLEKGLQHTLLLSKGHQVKFLQLLVPGHDQTIDATLSWKKSEEGYSVQVAFTRNNEAIFKLSGLFTPA